MIAWATEALIASAVLMLAVLLARGSVRRLFGAQVAYALWALPVLRLLLPPLPAAWREQAAMPITRAGEAVTVLIVPAQDIAAAPIATVAAAPAAATLPWGMIVAGVWALGAVAFFLYHCVRHRRFCRGLLDAARVIDEVDGVRVIETPAAAGPLAFGLRFAGLGRRFVAFPDDFVDRYDSEERGLALAHELGHHARGDLFANWVALAVLALHWFNPVAWRAFRAFRADQELANDARVLAGRSRTDRHIYACAIVKAAHGGAVAATCHLHTISDLKGRLRMLSISRLSRTRLAAGGTAVIGLVAIGLVATASGTQAAAAITAQVEHATGVTLAPPQPATPPVPAAPPASASAPAAVTKVVKRVVIVKDGRRTTYEGAAAEPYLMMVPAAVPPRAAAPGATPLPPVPPVVTVTGESGVMTVTSGDCQPATGPSVVGRDRDGRRVTIICRNRIKAMAEAAAARAEMNADTAERQAMPAEGRAAMAERRAETARRSGLMHAEASIRLARRTIEVDRNLSADQRRTALAGLDEALTEIRRERD